MLALNKPISVSIQDANLSNFGTNRDKKIASIAPLLQLPFQLCLFPQLAVLPLLPLHWKQLGLRLGTVPGCLVLDLVHVDHYGNGTGGR